VLQVELSKRKILKIKNKIKRSESIFSEKRYLESLGPPIFIIGRENEAEQIVKFLHPSKDGFQLSFVSIYGRSGTGKSTILKFVCENMSDVFSHCFVNLRRADTHFGCANLILENLDCLQLKSSAGINAVMNSIMNRIEETLKRDKKSNFVLILDEFDVIFSDKRRKGSDFIYMLLTLAENLRKKGFWLCIVAISNRQLHDYPLEERVRSRLDGSEIYFPPYKGRDVLEILRKRAEKAFVDNVDEKVLYECALLSSAESGDCRYALQLLRKTGEVANGSISVSDVRRASNLLQKDHLETVIETATGHQQILLLSMARLVLKNEKEFHSTKEIFDEYQSDIIIDCEHLEYRRVFDLLDELENLGVIISKKSSEGRFGNHKLHKLVVDHDLVGYMTSEKDWYDQVDSILLNKNQMEKHMEKVKKIAKLQRQLQK